jgi:hypothetical protein
MDTSIIGSIVIAVVRVALLATALAWISLIKRRQDSGDDPTTNRERRTRKKPMSKSRPRDEPLIEVAHGRGPGTRMLSEANELTS